ncbi:MAG: DUF1365 domain-containing protein [Thiobacillus sp.]|nr:DUF1365 domain-containing protein [Thiobacillus sp.]
MQPESRSSAQIGFGHVMHIRQQPTTHRFDYRVYFVRLPMHDLAHVESRWFSRNRFNLLSFHDCDHGDGGDSLVWARSLLKQHGLAADGAIWLTTFPRVLGYAFKPVSFWHCHRADGELVAVLAEVNNTFGERHVYLLRTNDPNATLHAEKVFHVSPFFPVRGDYTFQFYQRDDIFRARIDYATGSGETLRTAWQGRLQPLTPRVCLRAFFSYPLMTWSVIARIHLQALLLLSKRVPFFRKPKLPSSEVTE